MRVFFLKNNRIMRCIFMLVVIAAFPLTTMAEGSYFYDYKNYFKKIKTPHPVPNGYNNYLIYMADGFFNPFLPNPDSNLENCDITTLCDGEYFQKVIMGRSDEELAAKELEAKKFFKTRFDLDAEDPANAGRLLFRGFQVDPRINLHVVSFAGKSVPKKGWEIRDGGWIMAVIDPNGYEMTVGEFAGQVIPFGSFFVFSEYNIKVTKARKHHRKLYRFYKKPEPIIIQVKSLIPQIPGVKGFQCELTGEDLGDGLVQGRAETIFRPDGLTKMNIRGVLTFPGLGDVPLSD